MENTNKVKIAKEALRAIFAQQAILKEVSPDYNWNGLGNLLGDFGELVGIEQYGLTKAPTGAKGYDALTADGKTVQIKTSYASKQVNLRPDADLLLVLHVEKDAEVSTLYFGSFSAAMAAGHYSPRDNKTIVPHTRLRALVTMDA